MVIVLTSPMPENAADLWEESDHHNLATDSTGTFVPSQRVSNLV